jgi:hypothetical protein
VTDDEVHQMQRDLVHDLGQAVRDAQAKLATNQALDWVRAPDWQHKPSDDFEGCTE